MNIKRCDICGKEIDEVICREMPISHIDMFALKNNHLGEVRYDFCLDCSEYMYNKIKAAMQERKGAQT